MDSLTEKGDDHPPDYWQAVNSKIAIYDSNKCIHSVLQDQVANPPLTDIGLQVSQQSETLDETGSESSVNTTQTDSARPEVSDDEELVVKLPPLTNNVHSDSQLPYIHSPHNEFHRQDRVYAQSNYDLFYTNTPHMAQGEISSYTRGYSEINNERSYVHVPHFRDEETLQTHTQPHDFSELVVTLPRLGTGEQVAYNNTDESQRRPVMVTQPGTTFDIGYGDPNNYNRKPPDDYIIPSILVCILCCLPGGLCAIYYSVEARHAMAEGLYSKARQLATIARNLILVSVIFGIMIHVTYIVILTAVKKEPN